MKKLLMLMTLAGLVVPATFPTKAYGADEKNEQKTEKKKKGKKKKAGKVEEEKKVGM